MTLPYLTLGEVRRLTADLPDDTPLTAYDEMRQWYVNLDLTQEAIDIHTRTGDGSPSVTFDITTDVDTRQW